MTRTLVLMTFALLLVTTTTTARGDGLLFGFEGDTLPGTGTDWVIADACELDCSRRNEAGHFLLEWGVMGDLVNYSHLFAEPEGAPPRPRSGWSGGFGPTSPDREPPPVATHDFG